MKGPKASVVFYMTDKAFLSDGACLVPAYTDIFAVYACLCRMCGITAPSTVDPIYGDLDGSVESLRLVNAPRNLLSKSSQAVILAPMKRTHTPGFPLVRCAAGGALVSR